MLPLAPHPNPATLSKDAFVEKGLVPRRGAMSATSKLIVALDVPSIDRAIEIVDATRFYVHSFKIGTALMQTIIASIIGPREVRDAEANAGKVRTLFSLLTGRIFWDAKFSDIPNTVLGSVSEAAAVHPAMVTVHASCGIRSLKAAVAATLEVVPYGFGGKTMRPKIIAVTVLTSLDDTDTDAIFGGTRKEKVLQFAYNALHVGAEGIVCSASDLSTLRCHNDLTHLLRVVPGVRPQWAPHDDQSAVAIPEDAVAAGAHFLVVGRPILNPPPAIGTAANAIEDISLAITRGEIRRRSE
ncbi:MAG: orotidine 5'-phosphate decarboxylase [Candidatus Sungbacteria bacterium RIFCSPLOWO2_02_FULL_51_17]|uniref:Orotidine 5'-phosphate decarboxylase n=1 Tax=Candidatus Sungbacteria bacterium RIFCSPHIGHO2_02_FULL_51_29 TaxID=1802273 RepID=A0A1G2KYP3_9BACT|nr:MAG: orotidine 5'-phosphate decarboxylase [Candidatus Sungbacteria bacterium RIFCSPHIGHO2_02_FULL_51_29]OHA10766.1 MAG: orotidine 5'-phosphate decarboxylase [Candidatus Sungbacteria bacterium RIFCSPLOWO2_02_FULL_51_17]